MAGSRDALGLCGDLCGSLDGFDVSSDNGAHAHGWVVDAKLSKPNISSYVTIKVDGKEVLTALVTPQEICVACDAYTFADGCL